MLSNTLKLAAAGNAGAAAGLGIEDVFSTWLYTGNGSTQTITNGIDLAGEGGLVWLKRREFSGSPKLYDTSRGATKALRSDAANAESTEVNTLTSFNSDGFSIGTDFSTNTATYASWTFRKAEKFFDVVTFTTPSSTNTNFRVSHSLGSTPGVIIAKKINDGSSWFVYHRSLSAPARSRTLDLQSTGAQQTYTDTWGTADPTDSDFGMNTNNFGTNQAYVAYLFAHDEQIFGEGGDQSVIKCGSYTGNGSTSGPIVDLGWEPQWVMVKRATGGTGLWLISDNMRGIFVGANDPYLSAESSNAEVSYNWLSPLPTGFQLTNTGVSLNSSGSTYIYIAIRRGPMKTPESGTEVFDDILLNASSGTAATTGFPVDLQIAKSGLAGNGWTMTRLLGVSTNETSGGTFLIAEGASAEASGTISRAWGNTGFKVPDNFGSTNTIYWNFRRAPGFFDVVAYTGIGGTSAYSIPHNLGVVPEMVSVKRRDATSRWLTYHSGAGSDKFVMLDAVTFAQSIDSGNLPFNNGNFSATTFDVRFSSGYATEYNANVSGGTYIAYLFATCPGVSKVGSYTGTGTTLNVDCGFTSGARFVLIKRTDSTGGDWYVWDTARGIVSGNDPYLLLNSTAAEVTSTDYIDPLSSGFQISSSAPAAINASGGSYIFLAIA